MGNGNGEMEVSSPATVAESSIEGTELVHTLLTSTGLPEGLVGEELGTILESAGHSPATLTLDELRAAMLAYLESTFGDLEDAEDPEIDSAVSQS